jgi:hypothetical protein
VERSIGVAFGLGNQDIYAIGARPALAQSEFWCGNSSVALEPDINLLGIKSQESAKLQVRDVALLSPSVKRRTLDPETFRE